MSPKKWSKNTFGWARAEVLGALVNAVFLVALCFSISVESIKRFIDVEEIHHPENVLIVGFIGLLVNVIGLFLLYDSGGHGHSHGHTKLSQLSSVDDNENEDYIFGEPDRIKPPTPVAPKKSSGHGHSHGGHGHSHSAGQMNMRAAFLHVMSDALGSVIVMISALIIKYTEWENKVSFHFDFKLLTIYSNFFLSKVLLRSSSFVAPRSFDSSLRLAAATWICPHSSSNCPHTHWSRRNSAKTFRTSGRSARCSWISRVAVGWRPHHRFSSYQMSEP